MKSGIAAERYARALFTIVERRGEIFDALEDLRKLKALFARDPRLPRFLRTPFVPLEHKRKVIRGTLGKELIAPVADFLDLALRKKRVELFDAIAAAYEVRVRAWQGLQDAEVVSATPLTEEEARRLHEQLERITGLTIELSRRVDPELLGGLSVRIGDRVIDRSVRGLLASLRERLSEVSLTGATS
ncbi:MAG TPA: ATP synthase F1 subunit delta [Terriglobales bacterium]|nr:ATP synthase F1 subunit delta [Terriglobales bacterium]